MDTSTRKPWNGRLPLDTIATLKALSASTGKSQSDLVAMGVALLPSEKNARTTVAPHERPMPIQPLSIHDSSIHEEPKETSIRIDKPMAPHPASPAMAKALSDLSSIRSRAPLSKPGGKLL